MSAWATLARWLGQLDRAVDRTLDVHRALTTQTETVPPHPPGPVQPPAPGPDPLEDKDSDSLISAPVDEVPDAVDGEPERTPVVHRWPYDRGRPVDLPIDVEAVTRCCGRPTGALRGDRFSTNPRIITCQGGVR